MGKGQTATVRSITVGLDDGKAAVLPTISADGKQLSQQQAMAAFKADPTKHLGIFDSEANANAYAEALHQDQARALEMGKVGPTIPLDVLDKLQIKARAIRLDRLWDTTSMAVDGLSKKQADAYIAQVAEQEGLLAKERESISTQADHVRLQKKQEAALAKQEQREAFDRGMARVFLDKGEKGAIEYAKKYGPNVGLHTMASGISTAVSLGNTITQQTEDIAKASLLSARAKAGIPIDTASVLSDNTLSTKTKREVLGLYYDAQANSYVSLQNDASKQNEAGIAKIRETYLQDVLGAGDAGKTAYGITWDQQLAANFTTWAVDALKSAKDPADASRILTKGLGEWGSSGFGGGANFTRAEFEIAADRPYLITDKGRLDKIQTAAKEKIPADVYGIVESVHQEENKRLARDGKLPMPFNGASLLRLYESMTPSEWKLYKAKTTAASRKASPLSTNRVQSSVGFEPEMFYLYP